MPSTAANGKVRTPPRDYFERLRAPDHPLTDAEKKIALAEIRRRYAALREKYRNEADQFRFITFLRIGDLEGIFEDRYGLHLPDDDAGWDELIVMANHLAHYGGATATIVGRIVEWAALHAPTIATDRVAALASKVAARPIKWSADKLAWRMRLTMEDRTRLGITTIGAFDVGKKDRPEWLAAHHRKRKADDRRAEGVPTRAEWRANSDTARKPWEAMGMSRRTWHRRGKPMPEAGHGASPAKPARGTGAADHKEIERAARPVPTRTASRAAGQGADQEAPANGSAANLDRQRGGDAVPVHEDECGREAANPRRQRAAGATQPSIDAAPSFMDGTGFECAEAREVRAQAATSAATGIRHQMIDLARAVRAMPRPAFLIGQRGHGAPARVGWAPAASGGLGGWIAPGWVPQRVAGRL
jgi:hypothetical protein